MHRKGELSQNLIPLMIFSFFRFVIPKRFERLTHALEGRCSIQLSYGTYLLCKSWAQTHLRLQR